MQDYNKYNQVSFNQSDYSEQNRIYKDSSPLHEKYMKKLIKKMPEGINKPLSEASYHSYLTMRYWQNQKRFQIKDPLTLTNFGQLKTCESTTINRAQTASQITPRNNALRFSTDRPSTNSWHNYENLQQKEWFQKISPKKCIWTKINDKPFHIQPTQQTNNNNQQNNKVKEFFVQNNQFENLENKFKIKLTIQNNKQELKSEQTAKYVQLHIKQAYKRQLSQPNLNPNRHYGDVNLKSVIRNPKYSIHKAGQIIKKQVFYKENKSQLSRYQYV